MKIGKEYVNSKYVVYISGIELDIEGEIPQFMFTIGCLDGERRSFKFGHIEYANRIRNELIEEIEK